MLKSAFRKSGPQLEITWACVIGFEKFSREFHDLFTSSTAKNPILSLFTASRFLKALTSNFSWRAGDMRCVTFVVRLTGVT